MTSAYDVIIIGAGMVGATIACGLAPTKLKIAIVDPVAPPDYVEGEQPHIRVSALSYASEQILRNVGAWKFLEKMRICPYRHLAVNELPANEGIAANLPDISAWARTRFSAEDIGQEHLGHIAENDLIQLSLHQAMSEHENIVLRCPSRVTSMALEGDEKKVSLEGGEVLSAPLVIGADGARSQVRAEANIGQYKEQYEQHAFVATVSYQGEQQDITWQSFSGHGPLAFLPLADVGDTHYASLVWYDYAGSIDRLTGMSNIELQEAIQTAYPAALPELVAVHDRARFPLFKSHANQYVKPGLALVGDAAHTINPLAGQGVNLGLMDAAVLVETISKALVNGENYHAIELLRRYEKKRRLANSSMMSIMDVFYYGFENKHLPVRVARNLGLGIAHRFGFAKNKVMKYATGVSGDLPRLAKPA